MVDGINFNPFTNEPWSVDEFNKLNKNGDKVISYDELVEGLSWLSGGTDEDGEVDFSQFGDDLIDNVRKAGMGEDKNTISSEAELKAAMDTIADEYQEMYFTKNTDVDDSERSMIKNLINTTKADFIKTLTKGNKKGPWDLRLITDLFANEMKKAIADKEAALAQAETTKNDYVSKAKTGGENSLEELLDLITKANENKNISNAEWKQIKEMAVDFLLGQLLYEKAADGNNPAEEGPDELTQIFLSGLNKNYESDGNYKEAMTKINIIKSSSDPKAIKDAIDEAIKYLQAFLDKCKNKNTVASAAETVKQSKIEKQADKDLSNAVDSWLEVQIKSWMTDEEKQFLIDFAKTAKADFIKDHYATGTYVPRDGENKSPYAAFVNFLNSRKSDCEKVQNEVDKYTQNLMPEDDNNSRGEDTSLYGKLLKTIDNIDGYASESEKKDIIEKATDFVIGQMLSGINDINLLSALNPSYKSSPEFIEFKGIIDEIKTCIDPTKFDELVKKAKTKLQKLLDKYSGDQLVKAVDSLKPIEVSDTVKDRAIYNSDLYSDYSAGTTRWSGRSKDKQAEKSEIEQMARDDMRKYADSLKEQLKSEFGAKYNEAEIEKYIQSAMNDTLVDFWKKGDNGGFEYHTWKHGWGHRRKEYSYKVKDLIDTFTINFNKAAQEGSAQKVDPSTTTYDRENVLAESGLISDYTETHETGWNPSNDEKSKILAEAKLKLNQLSAQIKVSLIASGVKLDAAVIDRILNEATMETLKDYNLVSSSKFYPMINTGSSYKYGYTSKDLFDTFFTKVDEKLDAAKKKQ